MIQLNILSGKQAGRVAVARRFPFQVGRSGDADLALEELGVWEKHFVVCFEPGQGYVLSSQAGAWVTVNGAATQKTLLRNGDAIEIGAAKLQFWLAETRQRNLRFREWLVWGGIALVTVAQVLLIYHLLH